ncbi:DUF6191 domain-containing protein [Kitasatospora sp. NPDC058218]|uniref:DUF6191 domain-containing protein n=1 Tax=Kitasatospora sp. NPDC058218 TaxID=3346385 RepID=UPI0036D8D2D7
MVSFPGFAVMVMLFVFLETITRRIRRIGFVQKRLGERKERSLSNVALDVFTTTVSSVKEYELEERASKTMLRDEESDGAPPRSTVDLRTGRAVIVLPQRQGERA